MAVLWPIPSVGWYAKLIFPFIHIHIHGDIDIVTSFYASEQEKAFVPGDVDNNGGEVVVLIITKLIITEMTSMTVAGVGVGTGWKS